MKTEKAKLQVKQRQAAAAAAAGVALAASAGEPTEVCAASTRESDEALEPQHDSITCAASPAPVTPSVLVAAPAAIAAPVTHLTAAPATPLTAVAAAPAATPQTAVKTAAPAATPLPAVSAAPVATPVEALAAPPVAPKYTLGEEYDRHFGASPESCAVRGPIIKPMYVVRACISHFL